MNNLTTQGFANCVEDDTEKHQRLQGQRGVAVRENARDGYHQLPVGV